MKLEDLNPCKKALRWVKKQESYEKAWEICERGDWMIWIASKREVDKKKIIKVNLECVNPIKHLMKDERSLKVLEVADKYVKGEVSFEELRKAVDDASASAYAYAAAVACDATAAASAYAADEKSKFLSKCADVVRKHIIFEELNLNGE